MLITPIQKDKRFMITAGTILAVIVLVAVGKPPNQEILTFLGITLAAFIGQSQYGQTARTIAAGKAAAEATADVARAAQ